MEYIRKIKNLEIILNEFKRYYNGNLNMKVFNDEDLGYLRSIGCNFTGKNGNLPYFNGFNDDIEEIKHVESLLKRLKRLNKIKILKDEGLYTKC